MRRADAWRLLPQIIDGLIADGYKIVTLSDLVKTDTSLSKKLTSLTKATMPKDAVFPNLPRTTTPQSSYWVVI